MYLENRLHQIRVDDRIKEGLTWYMVESVEDLFSILFFSRINLRHGLGHYYYYYFFLDSFEGDEWQWQSNIRCSQKL